MLYVEHHGRKKHIKTFLKNQSFSIQNFIEIGAAFTCESVADRITNLY